MIYSVHGKLIHMEANLAVVECGGVGYKCLTTANTLSTLPPLGGEVRLLTWLQVRGGRGGALWLCRRERTDQF